MANFGEKLRKLRQRKKLSLDEMAEATKSSKSFLWELEKGTKNPSAEKLAELAKFFGVTLDYLMNQEDNRSFDTATEIFNRVNNLSLEDQEKVNQFIKIMFSEKK